MMTNEIKPSVKFGTNILIFYNGTQRFWFNKYDVVLVKLPINVLCLYDESGRESFKDIFKLITCVITIVEPNLCFKMPIFQNYLLGLVKKLGEHLINLHQEWNR